MSLINPIINHFEIQMNENKMKDLYRLINVIHFFLGGGACFKVGIFTPFITSPSLSHSSSSSSFLFLQPLARLGAEVLGIDPVEDSIGTARLHSSYDPELRGRVRYRACTLEELSEEEEEQGGDRGQGAGLFDAIVASEVVEHLADREAFALCCGCMLKVRVFPSSCSHLVGCFCMRTRSPEQTATSRMVISLSRVVLCLSRINVGT